MNLSNNSLNTNPGPVSKNFHTRIRTRSKGKFQTQTWTVPSRVRDLPDGLYQQVFAFYGKEREANGARLKSRAINAANRHKRILSLSISLPVRTYLSRKT